MSEYKAPLRDITFSLNEVLDYPRHCEKIGTDEVNEELVSAILEEAAKFAEQEIAPLNAVGDQEGCHWVDGNVTTPSGFKDAYQQFIEGGWCGLAMPQEYGGQGLPGSLNFAINEMLFSANHAWTMYPTLSAGAVETILAHGTDQQKNTFLEKLVAGQWSGTMCLTEAHCGSDLGLLRTKAIANDDGSYSVTGSKIFISAGDHDLTENIIHLVLARLPGAPSGVKGISLFIVPKFTIKADGMPGEVNGVSCGSIEEKMGIHGNATCVINFDSAKGYLIGEPNKGMASMFTFINESRLGVAIQGQAHMQVAYQKSLGYAKERVQMRASKRVLIDQPADPIIAHPDVRRMLLMQKSLAEGGRILNHICGLYSDIAHSATSADEKGRAHAMLAVLTPIAKGFLTEVSMEATQNGLQVLGGHGFIREWGLEQEYRDTRITAIYEGTNTIQALDLLGRKILASGGEILEPYMAELDAFCQEHRAGEISSFVARIEDLKSDLQTLTANIGKRAMEGEADAVGSAAFDYLMYIGYLTLAWCWAKVAVTAHGALGRGTAESAFYKSKLATADFYFERLLPRANVHATTLNASSDSLMQLEADSF
ncbi:acyl-CoA dehydrogenase [Spongiibacter sp. KMU-166]|uniref:Acyl-CoA dehydrogenase n=1 Tax=Spongiibacter thalassae TaxID=2721624 RepID=A0ABX1GC50_9GAMM|nr:acyl-CoA dehydrogenase C-terminal domain-containing protein [Spongiibacter thalassae]NKI16730.1 acyl-CoA dehydrogenase [Spongiibacter thalassae]